MAAHGARSVQEKKATRVFTERSCEDTPEPAKVLGKIQDKEKVLHE
jgi:hypothetical protein